MTETYAELRRRLVEALADFLPLEEARAEAHRWMEEGLGLDRTWLVAHGQDAVPPERREAVEAWMARRREGEPWSYILGWAPFRGRRFRVTRDTLIPRPETELVLEAALDIALRLHVSRCVDVGTGSGILAVCLALEGKLAVTATDLSAPALSVARENASALGAPVDFRLGHLLDPAPDPLGLVVSNPPYVDPADAAGLQRELAFEPPTALFAQERGLALATELLREARRRAAPACVLEIGAGQGVELAARARAFGWKRAAVHQDWAGHDRILMAIG